MSGKQLEVRTLKGWGDKYLLAENGSIYRKDPGGGLARCSQFSFPPRVRLYRRGKETRPYVHKLFAKVWPDRPWLAENIKNGTPPGGGSPGQVGARFRNEGGDVSFDPYAKPDE